MGFPGGGVPLGEDGECSRGRAATEGAHAADEGPGGGVVAHAGGDVDGVFEARRGVDVGGVAVEVLEELEGFGAVVPEAFQDLVDELWGPSEWGFF